MNIGRRYRYHHRKELGRAKGGMWVIIVVVVISMIPIWLCIHSLSWTEQQSKDQVDCGKHFASTCAECSQANGLLPKWKPKWNIFQHGELWCKGECYWSREHETCINAEVGVTANREDNKLVIFRTYRDSSWKNKQIYSDAMEVTQQNVPGATQVVFTDADIDKWMAEYFPAGTPEHAAYYSIHPQWGVARADLWRLLVVWVHGGLYLDMKSVALKPPPPLKEKMIGSRWRVSCKQNKLNEFINWYVYAPKKNTVLRYLIDAIIKNLKAEQSNTRSIEYHALVEYERLCSSEAKARVLYSTGPRALTLALVAMPEHLKQWITESTNATNFQNPLALDGAVKYESEKNGHIFVEGADHYTNLIDVPLTTPAS